MYFRGSGKAAEMKREAAKRTMMAALPWFRKILWFDNAERNRNIHYFFALVPSLVFISLHIICLKYVCKRQILTNKFKLGHVVVHMSFLEINLVSPVLCMKWNYWRWIRLGSYGICIIYRIGRLFLMFWMVGTRMCARCWMLDNIFSVDGLYWVIWVILNHVLCTYRLY